MSNKTHHYITYTDKDNLSLGGQWANYPRPEDVIVLHEVEFVCTDPSGCADLRLSKTCSILHRDIERILLSK